MERLSARQRMWQVINAEQVRVRAFLAICAAGLAAVTLTSIIGLLAPIDDAAPALIAASVAAAPDLRADASLVHRRQLYDRQHGRIKEATAVDGPAPTGN